MYAEGNLETTLQTVLVEKTLEDDKKVPERPLKLNLSLVEDRFNKITKKLAGI